MKSKVRKIGGLPEKFDSYEQAAVFWETHDTTDFQDLLTPVDAKTKLRRRHFEIEVDPQIAMQIRRQAKRLHKPVNRLVHDLLRRGLAASL